MAATRTQRVPRSGDGAAGAAGVGAADGIGVPASAAALEAGEVEPGGGGGVRRAARGGEGLGAVV